MLKHIVFITQKKIPDMESLKRECDCRKIALHYFLPQEDTLIEETIYITDKEEICRGLIEEGAAVLVWLHEENKEENLSSSSYAVENIEEVDLFYIERIYQRYQNLPWEIVQTERCIIIQVTVHQLI